MGYLDNAGLAHLWANIRSALAEKQDIITAGAGLIKDGGTLSVDIPVHRVLLQAEYDTLMDEQKRRGLFFIRGEAGAAENVSYAGEVTGGDEAAEIEPPDGEEDVDAEGVVIVDRIVINGERIGLNAANIKGLPAESGFPSGGIIIWSGASDAVPSGWVLCDGTNGTPDLRDRFVVGAGSTYAVGAKGGEAAHKLTVSEMPSHFHELGGERCVAEVYNTETNGPVWLANDNPPDAPDPKTDYTGGSQPHNNLPPYYALCYIMKL